MSWKGQRSRVSFRNLLRNKKTAIIVAVCCVAVVGAYAAYVALHQPTSKAGNAKPYHGLLNYDEETKSYYIVNNFTEDPKVKPDTMPIDMSAKSGNRDTLGTPDDPFVILEPIPWEGFSEMGYMIEGCEPIDFYTLSGVYDKEKAAYYHANGQQETYDSYNGTNGGPDWSNVGSTVEKCFAEEDYPGKGSKRGDWDYKYHWLKADKEITLKGYYECVKGLGKGYEGTHAITGLDKNGRPQFTLQEGGDFIWVSLGDGAPNYDYHKNRDNKKFKDGSTLDDVIASYKAGDREYTNRTESSYYYMNNGSYYIEDGQAYYDIVPKCMFVHYNDFLRYSIRSGCYNRKEIDNFSIVVKPADPQTLNKHPEWIDYADLIYLHVSSESGIANTGYTKWNNDYEVFNKSLIDPTRTATADSTFYQAGNDFTWDTAERLYMKANGLAKYNYKEDGSIDDKNPPTIDYTGDKKYGYAPIIIAKTIIDSLNGKGVAHTNPTYYINYETMRIQKVTQKDPTAAAKSVNSGLNNNFYKFCLMDLLMDQDVFYDLFYRPVAETGKPVIQTQKVNGVDTGICTVQEGDAQYFWCPTTFLPYDEQIAASQDWESYGNYVYDKEKDKLVPAGEPDPQKPGYDKQGREIIRAADPNHRGNKLRNKYGINMYSNAFMNFPGSAIISYTYIYNSNNTVFVLGTSSNLNKHADFTGGAFEWFEEERGEEYDDLSTLDIIHFLLNYKKGARNTDTSRRPIVLRVLDLEPGSDYTYLTETALRALFPATKYKVTFQITHMTTAELNGNKDDLIAWYDVIYIGTGVAKYNLSNKLKRVYNDTGMLNGNNGGQGWTYTHVGDEVQANAGTYRTSGDDITGVKQEEIESFANSGKIVILDTDIYNKDNSKLVAKGTNMRALAKKIAVPSKKNVMSLDDLRVESSVDFVIGNAEISDMKTPASYQNAMKDESGDNHLAAIEQDEDGKYRLTFTFKLGYEASKDEVYAARFLIDRNGDGLISEKETGADTVDTWDVESESGNVFTPGSDKSPMLDEYGDPLMDDEGNPVYEESPKEYTVSYIIPEDMENGAIAWKFVLYCTSNHAIRYEWTGVSRYTGYQGSDSSTTDDKRKLIRILQVGNDITGKANLEKELEKSGLFGKYANGLKDYKFDITTIPLTGGDGADKSDFSKMGYVNAINYAFEHRAEAKFKHRKFTAKIGSKNKDCYYPGDYIDNYDLYLFSCGAELEKADNNNGAVSFASWLVDKGYSVVFTSGSVYNDSTNPEAVKALKDSTGLSRFTASSDYAKKYVDKAYNTEGTEYGEKKIPKMEYTYYKALVTGDDSNKYKTYSNELWKDAKNAGKPEYGNKSGLNTTEGTQTNLGTVCVYPYTIDEDITLTSTTAQDYQLNLENPFADVWYCLGARNDKGENNSFYTISPNDASNNYYLYSVENVFYCGIQLTEIPDENVQEMQLFINTLIAASESPYVDPYVTVNNVYNEEKDKYEVGPSKKGNDKAVGLDYFKRNSITNKLTDERLLNAGINDYYESMVTIGDSGKQLKYKLYTLATPVPSGIPSNQIYSSGNITNTGDENTDETTKKELAGDEDNDEETVPEMVLKTSLHNSNKTSWGGNTWISADVLNSMKSTDELRINYHCDENMVKKTKWHKTWEEVVQYWPEKITKTRYDEKYYELSAKDNLFEIEIVFNQHNNSMSTLINAAQGSNEEGKTVNDMAVLPHVIKYDKNQLVKFIEALAKEKGQSGNLRYDEDGEMIFYGIRIKKVTQGWPITPPWSYTMEGGENPLVMDAIEIYQEEIISAEGSKESERKDITKENLYPVSADGKFKGDTHRIYFTPYAGTVNDDDVVELDIYFVRIDEHNNLIRTRVYGDNGKPQRCPLVNVYREKKGSDGKVTGYEKITNADGVFSKKNNGTLKSSTEYFLTYDKSKANIDGFQYIEFDISNEKKFSKTLLRLEPEYNPTPEDVYLFDLD